VKGLPFVESVLHQLADYFDIDPTSIVATSQERRLERRVITRENNASNRSCGTSALAIIRTFWPATA
jgi:hypothetical protein